VSLTVALLAGEAALRMSGRVHRPPLTLVSERPELYQAYPPYGYRLWPSRTTTYDYPRDHPRRLTVHSNRDGFRSHRELDQPDDRVRIAILGDSMVFGEGVEEAERFTDLLEAKGQGWRVDNLGMTGFGPDLMLRALQQVALNLRPEVVVMTLYTDDFRRVRPHYAGTGFAIPRFVLDSGQLVSVDYPPLTFWSRSYTVAAVRALAWQWSGLEWKINAAVLDQLRRHAEAAPFKLVLVFLPGKADTPNDQTRRAWLRAYANRTGTAFIDLTGPLLDDPAAAHFIPANEHLNPAGHQVVAESLRQFLLQQIGVRRR
jgi:lysophospholipase L1-like esterase